MEWKALSILIVICQVAVIVNEGPIGRASTNIQEENKSHKASIVLCHPEQTFFCVNMTHYSPCIHLDLTSLLDSSLAVLQGSEFYCGAHRCCQAGATTPCTYHCQRSTLDFENPQMPWNFAHLRKRKKKRSKLPLTSEEVDRLNKIVSVKSFIIRQKDLENWDDENSAYDNDDDDYDDYDEDNVYKWKPSYRTFCPLNKAKARASFIHPPTDCVLPLPTAIHPVENLTVVTRTITVTSKPIRTTIITGYTPSTRNTITARTTTGKPPIITTKPATSKPTTVTKISITTQPRIITTKPTTKPTRITTRSTTTKPTTTTARTTTTTRTTTTKRTKKSKRTTTKKITKSAKTKRTTTAKAGTGKNIKINPNIPCTAARLRWKLPIKGTCRDYTECLKKETKSNNVIYEWEIKSCRNFQHFSKTHQECRKMETVPCNINGIDNRNKRNLKSKIVD